MPLVVKGSSLSAQSSSNHGRPSAILNVEAVEKCGKTRLALTAPGPIAYFRVGDRKIDFLLAELGLKRGVNIVEGDYHYRPPIAVSKDGGDLVNTIANEARPIWKRFENDFLLTLKDKQIRSIVVDNAGSMYELRRLAKFGKLEQVPPIMYMQVNTEMAWYFTVGREFPDKNFLYIHRLKDKWVNVPNPKNPKGPKVGERTGELERAGWKDAGFEVDATVRLSKVKKMYTAEITDTGFSGLGDTFENEDVRFDVICAAVFGNRPKDWAR